MIQHCDYLVIGGGIAGISAASQLAEHTKTIVLEMEDVIGYHSTGRSAAIFIRNYGNAVIRALNAAADTPESSRHMRWFGPDTPWPFDAG